MLGNGGREWDEARLDTYMRVGFHGGRSGRSRIPVGGGKGIREGNRWVGLFGCTV